jgi:hypothetical protein
MSFSCASQDHFSPQTSLRPAELAAPAIAVRRFRIRPIRHQDVDRLAEMFLRVFRKAPVAANAALAEDIRRILVEHPDSTERTASLVFERADGDIGGLLGVVPIPMLFDGRPISTAALSTWMVEDRARDPEAGALLLRAHLKRRLDAAIADTVNRISIDFQMRLNMKFAVANSLQWVRPLSYAGYAVATAARRAGLRADGLAQAAARTESLALQMLGRSRAEEPPGCDSRDCSREEFAAAWIELVRHRRVRPDWTAGRVEWVLQQADRRPSLGPLRYRLMFDRGDLCGCVAYHIGPGRRGVALSVVARYSHEEDVLRAMFADARARGCVLICGPADPQLMEGFARIPGVFHRHTCSTLIKTGDTQLAQALLAGEGVLGGLVGDAWTPLATERYA